MRRFQKPLAGMVISGSGSNLTCVLASTEAMADFPGPDRLDHAPIRSSPSHTPYRSCRRTAEITIAGIELIHRICKDSSHWDISVFKAELRPQSGMRCPEADHRMLRQEAHAHINYLHRNPLLHRSPRAPNAWTAPRGAREGEIFAHRVSRHRRRHSSNPGLPDAAAGTRVIAAKNLS
jgi:hypothetical protein